MNHRELKFRVWDNFQNLWACPRGVVTIADIELWNHSDNGKTVEQFTGLHDKTGKEIYEGDILCAVVDDEGIPILRKYTYNLHVYFDADDHCWAGKTSLKSKYECESFPFHNNHYEILMDKTKIIGNIHENSELLLGRVNYKAKKKI